MLLGEPSYKTSTNNNNNNNLMKMFSAPARNYFRFDQEADPTDYNKHESWQEHLKTISNFVNKIRMELCHLTCIRNWVCFL